MHICQKRYWITKYVHPFNKIMSYVRREWKKSVIFFKYYDFNLNWDKVSIFLDGKFCVDSLWDTIESLTNILPSESFFLFKLWTHFVLWWLNMCPVLLDVHYKDTYSSVNPIILTTVFFSTIWRPKSFAFNKLFNYPMV